MRATEYAFYNNCIRLTNLKHFQVFEMFMDSFFLELLFSLYRCHLNLLRFYFTNCKNQCLFIMFMLWIILNRCHMYTVHCTRFHIAMGKKAHDACTYLYLQCGMPLIMRPLINLVHIEITDTELYEFRKSWQMKPFTSVRIQLEAEWNMPFGIFEICITGNVMNYPIDRRIKMIHELIVRTFVYPNTSALWKVTYSFNLFFIFECKWTKFYWFSQVFCNNYNERRKNPNKRDSNQFEPEMWRVVISSCQA